MIIFYLIAIIIFNSCTYKPIDLMRDSTHHLKNSYALDVVADEPVSYWRLTGPVKGAIDADHGGAISLVHGTELILSGSNFGGAQVSLECWLREAQGDAISYYDREGQEVLVLEVGPKLGVRLFGHSYMTSLSLNPRHWTHVGVSWDSLKGRIFIVVNGLEHYEIQTKVSRYIPFGGRLAVGGHFAGKVDEVVIFDRAFHPSQWIHRVLVAQGSARPTLLNQEAGLRLIPQVGHTQSISQVSWSPSGDLFATFSMGDLSSVSNDRSVKVWDRVTGALVYNLDGYGDQILGLSWSPDGDLIATISKDGTVKLWEMKTGTLLHELIYHNKVPHHIAWSPDGKRFATGDRFKSIKIWDRFSGKLIHDLVSSSIDVQRSLIWGEGDKLCVITVSGALEVWDGATGELLNTFQAQGGGLHSHAFHPDGISVATVDFNGAAQVRSITSGASLYEFSSDSSRINGISWSPNKEWIATTTSDNLLQIWDSKTGVQLHAMQYQSRIVSMSWSSNGQMLATSSADRLLRVWNGKSGALLQEFRELTFVARLSSWSPDDEMIAVLNSQGASQLWSWKSKRDIKEFAPKPNDTLAVSWSPDGNRLLVGNHNHTVQIWDVKNGILQHTLQGHKASVTSINWSPDETKVVTMSTDGIARIWDSTNGQLLSEMLAHIDAPGSSYAIWNFDGTKLATASVLSSRVKIWSSNGQLLHELGPRFDMITALAWSPNKDELASGSSDGTAKIWSATTGLLRHYFKNTDAMVSSLAWSPDGELLAVSARSTQIWRSDSGQLVQKLEETARQVTSVDWHPSGTKLITSIYGQRISVWDLKTGERSETFTIEDRASVLSVKWSPDGGRFASVSINGSVQVWDANHGHSLLTDQSSTKWTSPISWSPNSDKIAISGNGKVKVIFLNDQKEVSFISLPEVGWLIFDERNHYMGSGSANKLLAITRGTQVFGFEQLAPIKNRPDKILEVLEAPEELIEFNRSLWHRRLKRVGITPEGLDDTFILAPEVRILNISEVVESKVNISLLFKDRKALRGYQVFVNGVPVYLQHQKLSGVRRQLSIPLQLVKGPNQIEVMAINSQGIESLRVRATIQSDGQDTPKPKLYYLGFGVSDYRDDSLDLKFAHQDALDLESVFRSKVDDFSEIRTKTLVNSQVSEASIAESRRFLSSVTEHDTLVMFVAGHGMRSKDKNQTYYFLDHDTDLSDIQGSAIPFQLIERLLYEAKARKKLLLLDTCQSGDMLDKLPTQTLASEDSRLRDKRLRSSKRIDSGVTQLVERHGKTQVQMWFDSLKDKSRFIVQDLTKRSGAIVLASSLGNEASIEGETWANGAFTEELLNALQTSKADYNHDGKVNIKELLVYVTTEVPTITRNRQHPNIEHDNPLQHFTLTTEDAETFKYRKDIHKHLELVRIDPSDLVWQHDLALSHIRLGSHLKRKGRIRLALSEYQNALKVIERFTSTNEVDVRFESTLALIRYHIGSIHDILVDYQSALAEYQLGLAIQKRVVKLDPKDPLKWLRLAVYQRATGSVLNRMGRLALALEHYQVGLKTAREQLTQFPKDKNIKLSYIDLRLKLIEHLSVLLKIKWTTYQHLNDEFLSLSLEQVQDDRDHLAACPRAKVRERARRLNSLGYSLTFLGEAEREGLHRFEEAERLLRAALEIQLKISPEDAIYTKDSLCRVLFNLGEKQKSLTLLTEARGYCADSLRGLKSDQVVELREVEESTRSLLKLIDKALKALTQ